MATTMTAKQLAEELETDPRTLRKFLRSEVLTKGGKVGEDTPGKGGRYAFESRQIGGLKKRFNAWNSQRAVRVAKVAEATGEDIEDVEDKVA